MPWNPESLPADLPLAFLAKATVLLVAALLATIALRRAPAGARHLVWLGSLVAVLALPVLSRWLPLRLEVVPSGIAALAPGVPVEMQGLGARLIVARSPSPTRRSAGPRR